MYAIRCYRLPGYPFTHFREFKSSRAAKKAAEAALEDGWRMVEVLKLSALAEVDATLEGRQPLVEGRQPLVDWKVLETIRR